MANRDDPCCVYRYFDSAGQLLYVGITTDLERREAQHQASIFWAFVTDATVSRYPSVFEAAQVERVAIRDENPIFNRRLVPRGEQRARFARAVAYLEARPDVLLSTSAYVWGLGHRSIPAHLAHLFISST